MKKNGKKPARSSHVKNIWMVSREYGNLAGAGGVRDVVQQLSVALAKWSGRTVSVVLPLYGFMDIETLGFVPVNSPDKESEQLCFFVDMNYQDQERQEVARVWRLNDQRVNVYGIESERFSEKSNVYTYTEDDELDDGERLTGRGHYDYFAMNVLLQKAALDLMIILDEKPCVVHCHDGHSAVLPTIMKENSGYRHYFRRTGCLVTIHNAGAGYHQEVADLPFARAVTGLSMKTIVACCLNGKFNPFLAASRYAVMNTVSENYARELQNSDEDRRAEWLGHTLLGKGVCLHGITNGIDSSVYDTREFTHLGLACGYNLREESGATGKEKCKQQLLEALAEKTTGLFQMGSLARTPEKPLFTFVGRLSEQKGVDLLLAAVRKMIKEDSNWQLLLLGTGDPLLEKELEMLVSEKPYLGRCCFLKGFDPKIANQVFAAGDFLLVPSRFEPCGLTDFIAQLFGNLPIVHGVGGLVKVNDDTTGFCYTGNSVADIVQAMKRAVGMFGDKKKMREMQREAVSVIEKEFSWTKVMKKYGQLYKEAVKENRMSNPCLPGK